MLRELFGGRPDPASGDRRADLSLWVPDLAGPDASKLPTLYRGCAPLLRSRSVERLVQALNGELDDRDRIRRDDVVALDSLAVVAPATGDAALLPRSIGHRQPELLQLLEREGLRVVDGRWAMVSVETGALVVPRGIRLDERRLRFIERAPPARRRTEPLAEGCYPLRLWFRSDRNVGRAAVLVDVMRRDVGNSDAVGVPLSVQTLALALRQAALVPLAELSDTPEPSAVARGVARRLRRALDG